MQVSEDVGTGLPLLVIGGACGIQPLRLLRGCQYRERLTARCRPLRPPPRRARFGPRSEFGRKNALQIFKLRQPTVATWSQRIGQGSDEPLGRALPGKIRYVSSSYGPNARLSPVLLISGSLVRAQQAEPNCDANEGVTVMWPLFLCLMIRPGPVTLMTSFIVGNSELRSEDIDE